MTRPVGRAGACYRLSRESLHFDRTALPETEACWLQDAPRPRTSSALVPRGSAALSVPEGQRYAEDSIRLQLRGHTGHEGADPFRHLFRSPDPYPDEPCFGAPVFRALVLRLAGLAAVKCGGGVNLHQN